MENKKKHSILIVDNDPQVRDVIQRMILRLGYVAASVDNGEEALADFKDQPIELVITDIRLPGMSGMEVLKQIKAIDPLTQIIVLTGYGTIDLAITALKDYDAFDFLSKAAQEGKQWELVILDPPSFAPSESSVTQAAKAYTRLITLGAQVTSPTGYLAAASCSSHIRSDQFLEIVEESISGARRKATTLGIYGQPFDHPVPLAMPELRYLKFIVLQLD